MPSNHRLDHKSFVVPPGKKVRLKEYRTDFTDGFRDKAQAREALLEDVSELKNAQELLWASRTNAVIVILQALDAAGKDSTIEHVMSGVNPQGVSVTSFKAPTSEEKLHHFLWRPMRAAPERGRIGIFNRSYYEEVLVVRVHPEFLKGQCLPSGFDPEQPDSKALKSLWKKRYEEINLFEQTLVENGTCIVKFFLNVSKDEQKKRFLARLDRADKHWKFSAADVRERGFWDEYQKAYEEMLQATSTGWAPWYVIPADKKWFLRAAVADVIATRIHQLGLEYPKLDADEEAELEVARRELESESLSEGGTERK